MQKTHRTHHRTGPRYHIRHFLNLLPVAQCIDYRSAFGDPADAALHDGDALIDCTVESVNCAMVPYEAEEME